MTDQLEAKKLLIEFLSGFPALKVEDRSVLAEQIPVITAKKGQILLKEGTVPQACYYVLKGMVRQYRMVDGVERTTEFYTENNGTVSSEHFTDQTASGFYLECAEDCVLIAGTMQTGAEHYEQFPELLEITRKMMESDLNDTKKRFSEHIIHSPMERYLKLTESRPELLQRAPLSQIASYLGLTPESLSRIRKRLASK